MNFEQRLKEAMQVRNISQTELVEKTGISKSGISQYLSGEYKAKQDRTYLLAKALDVDPSWLMGKDVPMDGAEYKRQKTSVKSIPLLGTIAAGIPILAEENIEDYFNLDSRIKADFALRVKGDSMRGAHIYNGDIVFIRKQEEVENGQIAAVLMDDEATLKKFYREDHTIILQSENSNYKPLILTGGDVHILGKMVAVLSVRE